MLLPRPLSLAIDRIPLPVLQQVVDTIFQRALSRHPGLFDRLGPEASKRFRFTPADLDLSFIVHPAGRSITLCRKDAAPPVAAAVSGPLLTLLALLEGRIDGDAVFFARSLTVTGDMEAMLALRNALDDCGFDLPRDLSGLAGPLAGPARRLAEALLPGEPCALSRGRHGNGLPTGRLHHKPLRRRRGRRLASIYSAAPYANGFLHGRAGINWVA